MFGIGSIKDLSSTGEKKANLIEQVHGLGEVTFMATRIHPLSGPDAQLTDDFVRPQHAARYPFVSGEP